MTFLAATCHGMGSVCRSNRQASSAPAARLCPSSRPASFRQHLAANRGAAVFATKPSSETEADSKQTNSATGTTSDSGSQSESSGLMSEAEIKKLAELRRQGQQRNAPAPSSNILQGALDEAQLITWPKPQKAFQDTILVLGILIVTGFSIFAVNLALASASEWWYHRG